MKVYNLERYIFDWGKYKDFSKIEFACKYSHRCHMNAAFMDRLQSLRTLYGKPMVITSGFRDPSHPAEVGKIKPGPHTTGRACDVAVGGADALLLIQLALEKGFTGIGIQQKGVLRFLHLDDLPAETDRPRPFLWSY